MKKIISISLAVIMIIAIIPFSAFAAAPAEAYAKMTAARDKLYAGKESFSAAESYDFWLYLSAEGSPDAYRADYINSVKSAVKENTLGDAANYALAIMCLDTLGVEATAFEYDAEAEPVNLYTAMEQQGVSISSPYLYRYIFEAGTSRDFTTACVEELDKGYTAGQGIDPWNYGYSCDTDASLAVCYAASGIADEKAADLAGLLNQYKTPQEGYFYDSTYTGPNADSTGCALYVFGYMFEKKLADEAYEMLKNFEVKGENGAYCSSYAPGYDAFATKDALRGLIEYNKVVDYHEHSFVKTVVAPKANALGYTCYKCSCGELKRDASGKIIKTAFKAPTGKVTGVKCAARTAAAEKIAWNKVNGATGYQAQIILNGKVVQSKALSANAYVFTKLASGSAYKVRVRFYIKAADGKNYFSNWSAVLTSPTLPKGTGLTKLTAAKKAFSAKWAKQAGVTGYQINYKYFDPQSKGGAPHCKTITIKGAAKTSYAAKKLMAKTTYQVKVRTYKTIGGKNYYSAWSKIKTVKTK